MSFTSRRARAPGAALAMQVREQFVAQVQPLFPELGHVVLQRLGDLGSKMGTAREMQDWRDMLMDYQQVRQVWVRDVAQQWREALTRMNQSVRTGGSTVLSTDLALIDDDVVENKITASRLSMAIMDKVNQELNDLRLRILRLENLPDLGAKDVLKPDTICRLLIEQWMAAGMSRKAWLEVHDTVRGLLSDKMVEAYHDANEFLVQRGVMAEINLRPLVRRSLSGRSGDGAAGPGHNVAPDEAAAAGGGDWGGSGGGYSGGAVVFGDAGQQRRFGGASGFSPLSRASGTGRGRNGGQSAGAGGGAAQGATVIVGGSPSTGPDSMGHPTGPGQIGRAPTGISTLIGRAQEETRMLTVGTPLARARQRASGLLGQLRRMLTDRVADFERTRPDVPSSELAQALQSPQHYYAGTDLLDIEQVIGDRLAGERAPGAGMVDVERIAVQLRQRTSELKQKAGTQSEKATIEIVALMFQSILAEERIPAAVRVWFARLQMPVLRLALAEPDFFSSLQHPARQLIDRMGACALGFDAVNINGSKLEAEIKRIVQVVEQYPETGRKVFQLVLDEFQKFLSTYLTESVKTHRVISVAQQVELKETLAIQYTIELRKMLGQMPVRDEIREFFFKIWAEVLALAAVRHGPQNEETLALKRAATDLLWAASAKPSRDDRARVIQGLPALLQRLRQGMALLGIEQDEQDYHIRVINDILADAFMSRTDSIPQDLIDEMARRLSDLESVVQETGAHDVSDFPVNPEDIAVMLGMDAENLIVISDGGSQPTQAMLHWARELEVGHWYLLDHNGQLNTVQYVWRSDRRQLHLFALAGGAGSYLVQVRRLAAYLQAGLLVPAEDESLTVRATRDAMAKIDANPERLLV